MNLKEFEKWALEEKSVGNPTPEQSYKGECVSLIQQYLSTVHNISFKARGNAKDWSEIKIEGFTKLKSIDKSLILHAGDILVYNYGKYGHLSLITTDGKMLDQNKNGNRKIAESDIDFNYACVHRPDKIDLGTEEKEQVFKVRVDKDVAYVRREPNINSAKVIQPSGRDYLAKGIVFNAVAIVNGEDPYRNGNNKWYKSQKGNFVWSGGLTII